MDRTVLISTTEEADDYIKDIANKHGVTEDHILKTALGCGIEILIENHKRESIQ